MNQRIRLNWITNTGLLVSGLLALLSGIYFLLIPSGGYQGGRNPMYGVTILFERHSWRELHQWSGLAMIALSAIHIVLHWEWFKAMIKCTVKVLLGRRTLSPKAWVNLSIIVLVGFSFLIAAVSGLPFLNLSGEPIHTGGNMRLQANRATLSEITTLNALKTWEAIHTWASIAMVAFTTLHLVIHWSWVTRTTARLLRRQSTAGESPQTEKSWIEDCQAFRG